MKKHFVVFCSPGTFFSETSEVPIPKWDPRVAIKMARKIKERHGARPYGFYFITKSRGPNALDSKISKKSKMFYLNGRVMTLEEVKNEWPHEKILISNMECNHWDKIIVNDNSWRATLPFEEGDTILKWRIERKVKDV